MYSLYLLDASVWRYVKMLVAAIVSAVSHDQWFISPAAFECMQRVDRSWWVC